MKLEHVPTMWPRPYYPPEWMPERGWIRRWWRERKEAKRCKRAR